MLTNFPEIKVVAKLCLWLPMQYADNIHDLSYPQRFHQYTYLPIQSPLG